MRWTDADRVLLREAVRAVEAKSRAELVVAVRSRSDSYSRGPLLFGAVVAWGVLGFELFSPYEFPLDAIFLEPAIIGACAAFLAGAIPDFTRVLASPKKRRESVERAAHATFQERGVGLTRERTGVLLYLSLLEREAVVVADKGITDMVPPDVWTPLMSRVVESARSAPYAAGLAAAVRLFVEPLAAELPSLSDDVDELADLDEMVQ